MFLLRLIGYTIKYGCLLALFFFFKENNWSVYYGYFITFIAMYLYFIDVELLVKQDKEKKEKPKETGQVEHLNDPFLDMVCFFIVWWAVILKYFVLYDWIVIGFYAIYTLILIQAPFSHSKLLSNWEVALLLSMLAVGLFIVS